jgi:hypothetical protein
MSSLFRCKRCEEERKTLTLKQDSHYDTLSYMTRIGAILFCIIIHSYAFWNVAARAEDCKNQSGRCFDGE